MEESPTIQPEPVLDECLALISSIDTQDRRNVLSSRLD